jgi:hypothetical protein
MARKAVVQGPPFYHLVARCPATNKAAPTARVLQPIRRAAAVKALVHTITPRSATAA